MKSSTVNTRYRHTPGTSRKCARIVIVSLSDNRDTGTYEPVSRYRHICGEGEREAKCDCEGRSVGIRIENSVFDISYGVNVVVSWEYRFFSTS